MTAISEPARNRGPGRPWQPGQSGNPSGLSKDIAPLVAEARRLALSYAPKSIEALASLLDNEDPEVRIAAATALLDRGGLRPFSLEPERLSIEAVPVDVDALRASLMVRVAALAAGQALPPGEPVATPEPLVLPPRGGEAPAMSGRPLPRPGNPGSEAPPEVRDA